MLPCQAGDAAPIIITSQSRLSDMDREGALADDQVRLAPEAGIAPLHEKVDFMRERELPHLAGLLRETLTRLLAPENRGRPA